MARHRRSNLPTLFAIATALAVAVDARGGTPAPPVRYMFEKLPGRHALVIGNRHYVHLWPIPSAESDATAVASRLTSLGFTVTLAQDGVASTSEFEDRILPSFRPQVAEGDLVVLYYSGHGFSYGPESYLAPADLKPHVLASELGSAAIPVSALEEYFARRNPGFLLIVLDSCRTIGGFVVQDQGGPRGPAKGYRAPLGHQRLVNTLVAYATWAGEEAEGNDDPGKPSTFTGALERHLADEGLPFGSMFKLVSEEVLRATKDQQQPGLADWSVSELYLRPTAADLARQREAWIAALTSSSPLDAVDRYLRLFALSPYAAAARAWRKEHADEVPAGYSLLSPAGVERAWAAGGTEPVALERSASVFAFSRTLGAAPARASLSLTDDAIGVWTTGRPRSPGTFAMRWPSSDVLAMLGDSVTTAPLDARSGPSAAAPLVKHLPTGTPLQINQIGEVGGERTWASVTLRGNTEQVFVPVDAPSALPPPASLGRPLRELSVPRLSGANGYAVDSASVEQVLASIRAAQTTVSWVSLAVAPTADEREADRRAAAVTHLEYLLKNGGIDGTRITSFLGASDVPNGEIRVRFFGY